MTSFLRINGLAVPVAVDSAEIDQEDIGSQKRAADGTPLFNRRTTKRTWQGRTVIKTAAEALAWRDLVTGKGHTLSFERNNLYTSKGLAPTSFAGGFTIANTNAKFGTYRGANTANNTATWTPFTATSPWTVAFYRSTDGGVTWHHWVKTSAGGQWLDGAVDVSSMAAFFGVAAGVVTLGGTAAGSWDDVLFFPQVVPSDWPAQMAAFGSPIGELARLTVDGAFVEQNGTVTVKGKAGKLKLFPVTIGGVFVDNAHTFSFELLEN